MIVSKRDHNGQFNVLSSHCTPITLHAVCSGIEISPFDILNGFSGRFQLKLSISTEDEVAVRSFHHTFLNYCLNELIN